MTEPSADTAQPARPRRTRTLLWVVLGLLIAALVAALVAAAFYKAWPLLYPKVLATAPLDPGCDLRSGPCTALFPGGRGVRFGVEPRTIPPLTPLRIAADLTGIEAHAVEVDFSGTDMSMGYNRIALAETQVGRYEGQGMLPACVRSRMGWEARVMLHTSGGILVAPFRFETISRP